MRILLSSICLETGTDIQLALYYLKAYLLRKEKRSIASSGVRIQVFNENRNDSDIVARIERLSPDLVAFSCYVWNISTILRICSLLKKLNPRITTVLGGPEVSSRAKELLAGQKAIDIIVRGEGEVTFASLAHEFLSGTPDLFSVAGISFRQGVDIIHNPDRPHLHCLDVIPSPYLSGLVDLKDKEIVDVPLETTRGCAFRCHYCYYHKNFPDVRYFSLTRVEKELKLILAAKPHELYLMDATFNANPARAKKILRMFIKYNRGANLHVELKAELLDEEMARLLFRARAYNIEIGIQSTNQKTLRAINRSFNKEQFARGIGLLNTYKLYYEIQLIDALPYQSYKNILDSLNWLYSLRPAKVIIFHLSVLPGTVLRERAAYLGIHYEGHAPYYAQRSEMITSGDLVKIERLRFAMDRVYDSAVFQKTLYGLVSSGEVRVSEVLEDWVRWEASFKRHGVAYVEFLNKKLPDFLHYVCRRHGLMRLYKTLLPDLQKIVA
ncbi:MAG TPA: radical SAM protein [Candidatus Omnitrophota bacterium]|nr:radical SAM protein [Candidatus Omnitrophota bacterium]